MAKRNQVVSETELEAIRGLADFDLTMFISELHDQGWPAARALLRIIPSAQDLFDDAEEVSQQAAASENDDVARLGIDMAKQVAAWGGQPTVLIGSKLIGNEDVPAVDYMFASPLEKEKILYVLRRTTRLLEGWIKNQAEKN